MRINASFFCVGHAFQKGCIKLLLGTILDARDRKIPKGNKHLCTSMLTSQWGGGYVGLWGCSRGLPLAGSTTEAQLLCPSSLPSSFPQYL